MRRKVISLVLILVVASIATPLGLSAATTAPVARNDSYTVNENNILDISAPGVLANDTAAEKKLSAALVSSVKNGVLILNSNGSFIYVPDTNFHGTDTFTYVASNGTVSNEATVTITVKPVNLAPIARNDFYNVNENGTLKVLGHGVLANDTDPDGDPISAVLVSNPLNGALVLDQNGSFVYKPNTNFHGMDSFTYEAFDTITTSNLATVAIDVNQLNSPQAGNNPILQLIEQIQSMLARITGLETQVQDLKAKNDALETRVHQVELALQHSPSGTGGVQTNTGQGSEETDSQDNNQTDSKVVNQNSNQADNQNTNQVDNQNNKNGDNQNNKKGDNQNDNKGD